MHEANITPWRRAVVGDLTSIFNFANPNSAPVSLPGTNGFLPPVAELAGGNVNTFVPTLGDVIIGVPAQEKGVRSRGRQAYRLTARGRRNLQLEVGRMKHLTRLANLRIAVKEA